MDGGQAGVGPEVGDLVLQILRAGRLLGCGSFESVDLRSKRGDLGARRLVGLLQVLDTPDQRLVAGNLVGRGEELSLDLARQEESRRQGDGGHAHDAQDPVARHDAIVLDPINAQPPGVVSKFAHGGRNTRLRFPDRPASL